MDGVFVVSQVKDSSAACLPYLPQAGAGKRKVRPTKGVRGSGFLFRRRRGEGSRRNGFGMFHFAVLLRKPGAHFAGMILEWTVAAAIADPAVFVDDIEALRPGGIGIVGGIVHFIDAEGQGERKATGEIVCNGDTLLKCSWLRVANIIFEI